MTSLPPRAMSLALKTHDAKASNNGVVASQKKGFIICHQWKLICDIQQNEGHGPQMQ